MIKSCLDYFLLFVSTFIYITYKTSLQQVAKFSLNFVLDCVYIAILILQLEVSADTEIHLIPSLLQQNTTGCRCVLFSVWAQVSDRL